MIEGEWPLGLALIAGMLLMALLDGEWTRWRQRRWVRQWRATREPLPLLRADLRLVLGTRAQPHAVRVVARVYDWREQGL